MGRRGHLAVVGAGSWGTAFASVLARASTVVVAVPSHCLREKMGELAPLLSDDATVVSLTKGLEPQTLMRMSQVIAETAKVPEERVAVVSGPNLAKEVAEGVKSCGAICEMAAKLGVDMPIATRVARVLYDGADVQAMVEDLLLRDPEPEFLGISS